MTINNVTTSETNSINHEPISYEEIFTKERNEFFKQGGFRSTNYKHAKTRCNRLMRYYREAIEKQDMKKASEIIEWTQEVKRDVDIYYFEAKNLKECGKTPLEVKSELADTIYEAKIKAKKAVENQTSLEFLRDILYNQELLYKIVLSKPNNSLKLTLHYLTELYRNSLECEKPRVQQNMQTFVNNAIQA